MKYVVRGTLPADLHFIIDSWLNSYLSFEKNKHGKTTAQTPLKFIRKSVYFENQPKVIEHILQRSDVLIACNGEDLNHIYGYIVFQKPNVMHYIYVSHIWRRMGVAEALIKAADLTKPMLYTHHTDYMRWMKPRWGCEYNPYLAIGI